MYENEKSGKKIIGYEYTDIHVNQNLEHLYTDGYSNFGWELETASYETFQPKIVTLKFKRDRELKGKAELTRLQYKFNAVVEDIQFLERSKVIFASVVGYAVGIIGTAFVAGSVFAVTAGNIPFTIVLAVPGFLGWIISYLIYGRLNKKKAIEVAPEIDQKYDEIYDLSKEASSLLNE